MNILSQKETNCIYGGNMLNDLAKKAKKKAQEIADEAVAAANKKILEGEQAILNKIF